MDSVADRYAIALLSLAREENIIPSLIEEVEQVITIFNNNPDLLRILKDYGLTKEEKKETVDLCFKDKINVYILNTFYILIDNKRGAFTKEVMEEFVRLAYKDLNIKKGIVYSTIKLTKSEMKKMEERTSELLKAKVILENRIDTDLIGGFKIQVEDVIIDQSIKKRLESLKTTLLKKEEE